MPPTSSHRREALDLVVLGEALVEFSQLDDDAGAQTYRQGFAGDSTFFAVAAARQGARVAHIGALGHDIHGEMLRDLWDRENIDRSGIRTDADAPTAISFRVAGTHGRQQHDFRRGSAASRTLPRDLPRPLMARARMLHLSGVSLAIGTQACDTGFAAIELAHDAGARVSFDTRFDRRLWSLPRARAVTREALRLCQVALAGYDDMVALAGIERPEGIVDHCLDHGAEVVALKLGVRGAIVANATERHHIRASPVRPVDDRGAGDVFGGAFVARLLAGDPLLAAGRYAAAAAGLALKGGSGIDAIPRAAAVRKAMGG